MVQTIESETETTIGRMKEIYNLRSRKVSIASRTICSPVSKAPKEETATGNKSEDEASKAQKEETAQGKKPKDKVARIRGPDSHRAPPPLTGRRLKKHLREIQLKCRELAKVALYWYNRGCRQRGLPRYMLVKTMKIEGRFLGCGTVYHLNFKARPKDDPAAPPEFFFAERVISWRGLKKTLCYSMGTESPEPATVGRNACTHCYKTNHPRDKEFAGSLLGRPLTVSPLPRS